MAHGQFRIANCMKKLKLLAALIFLVVMFVFVIMDVACLIGAVVGGNVVLFGIVIGGETRMQNLIKSVEYTIAGSASACCLIATLANYGKSPSQDKPASKASPLLPSPVNAMSSEEVCAILQRYGVADLVTAQDDPVFWATVLQHYWPVKEIVENAARPNPPIYSFGIKEASKETNIWSHAPRTKSVRLTSSTDGQLRPANPGSSDGQKHPGFSIDVSRPSVGRKSAWFENGRQFGPTFGNGTSGVCRCTPEGIWSAPMASVRSVS